MDTHFEKESNYLNRMISDLTLKYERRRRVDYEELMATRDIQPIKVTATEFYVESNAEKHHTNQYDLVSNGTPVLRRGQSFYFAIRFDRAFREGADLVRFSLNIGPTPSQTKGTSTIMLIRNRRDRKKSNFEWSVNLDNIMDDTIVLQCHIPVTAPVGCWTGIIYTSDASILGVVNEYKCEEYLYILFNPWCKDDGVYIENDEEREEYVLNDIGKIWKGTFKQPEGFRWVYGQFDEVVLPVVMILLERSDISHADRWNPVKMARAIAAVANTQDDFGLLQGEWTDFTGGTSPFAWTGTVAIMEEFLKNGCMSVKFGQCWVFAGVINTISRALGIPCRPITNYHSAHDTNGSLTVDVHYNSDGEKIEELNIDSCWNFHVWNEMFMSRPDLAPGYGGWQVIDGTPQEISEEKYRCGPASVEAIRRGDVGFSYDTKFVYTEVNGDICSFQLDEDKTNFSVININKDYVGKQIVTKKIGPVTDDANDDPNIDMEDVTPLYKFLDEKEEKLALYNAIRSVPLAQQIYEVKMDEKEDVKFDLSEIESIPMGEPFRITVNVKNLSGKPRTITIMMSASSILYTGVTVHQIKKSQATFTLKPKQDQVLSIPVKPEDYFDKLADHGIVKMYAIANVEETKQTWIADDDFVIATPTLDIEVKGVPATETVFHAIFSFKNPMPHTLINCSFSVQMLGARERPDIIKFRDIGPKELVSFTYTFSPKSTGERTIIATFASKHLSDITGSKTVLVQ